MNTWTPDRPTKPGKYWLSLHPRDRENLRASLIVEIDNDGDVLCAGCLLRETVIVGAQWLPYVEPPDPFAEPMPKPSEFKAYRLSDDAKTPNLRLILDVEPGIVTLYEADMTSRSPEAQETDLHDKILMSQADARWLRDTLNNADLSDPPGWDR
jgi:hypothetical protein